jgi:uncharacterized protein YprB with RNaseH-like and TPR domain
MTTLRDRLNALRPGAARREAAPAPASVPLADAPRSAHAHAGDGPELRVSRVPMPEWDAGRDEEVRLMGRLSRLARDPAIAGLRAADLLFLDLETTGLSLGAGTIAFLVGIARLQGGELVVEQHLLRALAHEAQALRTASELLRSCGAVVTFNGKSYDVPLLLGRCVLARVEAPPSRPHFDALHPSRRLLSHELPDARLVSLEVALLGMRREDDLGGAAIPAAFFAALRGDDGMMDDVLRHNADDLVTLARLPPLLARLADGHAAPTGLRADPLALARIRIEDGERERALRELERAHALPGSPRALRTARLAKRAGGAEGSRDHWSRLCREPRAGAEPHEELAKILEHNDRDWAAALSVVERALRRFRDDADAARRLMHRRARLLRRLGTGASPAESPPFPDDAHSG